MKKKTILFLAGLMLICMALVIIIFHSVRDKTLDHNLPPITKAVMKTISSEAALGEDAKNIYEKLMADADEEEKLVYEFNKEHAANTQVKEIFY